MAVVAEADKLRATGRRPGRLRRRRAALRHAAAHQGRGHRGHPEQFHQVHGGGRHGRAARRHRASATRPTSAPTTSARKCIASTGGKHALFNAHPGAGRSRRRSHPAGAVLGVVQRHRPLRRRRAGAASRPTKRSDFALTAEMVERAITPRTKIIILNSPINPSGAVMKPEDMTRDRAAGARARHLRGLRRVLRLSQLHRAAFLGGIVAASTASGW